MYGLQSRYGVHSVNAALMYFQHWGSRCQHRTTVSNTLRIMFSQYRADLFTKMNGGLHSIHMYRQANVYYQHRGVCRDHKQGGGIQELPGLTKWAAYCWIKIVVWRLAQLIPFSCAFLSGVCTHMRATYLYFNIDWYIMWILLNMTWCLVVD